LSTARQTVQLVEQGGRGGVFQHTVALARLLAENGLQVILHTASDPELDASGAGVTVCGCVDWLRRYPPSLRRPALAARYIGTTLPHLLRETRGALVHVQGTWNPPLAALTLAALRSVASRVVFSPHNTFARTGSAIHGRLLRLDLRLADATVVFSEYDASRIGPSMPVHVSPLIQIVPEHQSVDAWRSAWEGAPVALFAGQLRRDKRLDRVISAISTMSEPPLLAVVGEDKGAAVEWQTDARRAGVRAHWSIGFQPLERFAAAIAAADVVVCPYEQASQSGVISLASELGVPTVAHRVGGLSETATFAVDSDDRTALARAIECAIRGAHRRPDPNASHQASLLAHRRAYGLMDRCEDMG
jgi:glycosyltransferase involved in cell wall biosynthesis